MAHITGSMLPFFRVILQTALNVTYLIREFAMNKQLDAVFRCCKYNKVFILVYFDLSGTNSYYALTAQENK